MSLPKRVYYPLPEAANRIGCSIRDVIHYGANGELDFYAFINNFNAPGNSWFHLNMPSGEVGNIDYFGCLSGDGWIIHNIEKKKESDGFIIDGYYAKSINGFFYIGSESIRPLEFCDSDLLETIFLSSGPDTKDSLPVEVNCIMFHLALRRDYLCVLDEDINKLIGVGPESNGEVSQTVFSNQASMLKSLLAIHYGEDVANKPRKFLEDKDSEICKDFQLKGIKVPSGKTVAHWLKDVDIDFLP